MVSRLEARLAQRRAQAPQQQSKSFSPKTKQTSKLPGKPAEDRQNDPDAFLIKIDDLVIRPQIRKHFDDEALQQLSDDMRVHGQDAAVLVRALDHGRYELIDGERRVRAKRKLHESEPEETGHTMIRATLRNLSEPERLLRQLAANIQREALQPVEEAQALASIKQALQLTDEALALRINKSQSYVSRALSLLRLSEPLQYLVERGAVGRRRAISQQEAVLQAAIASLPPLLQSRIEAGDISVVDAFKANDEAVLPAVSGAENSEPVSSVLTPKKSISPGDIKVSISLKTANDLASLLRTLAGQLNLSPIELRKKNGKRVRKELLAVLEQRSAQIKSAVKGGRPIP